MSPGKTPTLFTSSVECGWPLTQPKWLLSGSGCPEWRLRAPQRPVTVLQPSHTSALPWLRLQRWPTQTQDDLHHWQRRQQSRSGLCAVPVGGAWRTGHCMIVVICGLPGDALQSSLPACFGGGLTSVLMSTSEILQNIWHLCLKNVLGCFCRVLLVVSLSKY